MRSLRLKSYAKINLTLRIVGLRRDGYHELDSIMQSVSLRDEITLAIAKDQAAKELTIVCNEPSVPTDERNLVWKAYRALKEYAHTTLRSSMETPALKITIKKRIPVAAGLAGGSGNAAAVLVGLNRLWGLKLSQKELMTIGAGIGADIPFCLGGGLMRCQGKGEKLSVVKKADLPLELRRAKSFVLVVPDLAVSTPWAYQEWDRAQMLAKSPKKTSLNDLEAVVVAKHPQIGEIIERLRALGCEWVQMSGSGPSVVGKLPSLAVGKKVLKTFGESGYSVYAVSIENKGVRAPF